MRWLVELVMRVWPLNRLILAGWRHAPFPRGARSRIMRRVNDRFLVGVVVVICDDSDRVLLVRNTYNPRFVWSLPGGWMGKNEQPAECIQRELGEETGFEIEVDALLAARTHDHLPSVDLVYRGRIVGGEFRASAEVVEARFFPPDQLPEGMTPLHERMLATTRVRSRP